MAQSDASEFELVVSRVFTAPAELVFDAWLDPAHAGRWLFATAGGQMRRVEIDPRVGGAFTIAEQRGEMLAEHFGQYIEIDRPRRLVFSFRTDPKEKPSSVTIEITPVTGGCELKLTHRMDTKWADYIVRVRGGWTKMLEALERALSSQDQSVM